MAVALLWRFRLRAAPLSLSSSLRDAKGILEESISRGFCFLEVYLRVDLREREMERGYSRSLMGMSVFDAKAICGTTSLRVTVLASLTEGNEDQAEIEKNKQTKNNTTQHNNNNNNNEFNLTNKTESHKYRKQNNT